MVQSHRGLLARSVRTTRTTNQRQRLQMAKQGNSKSDPSIIINGPVAQGPGGVIGPDNSTGKVSMSQDNYQLNFFFDYRPPHDPRKHFTQLFALFSGLGMVGTGIAIAGYEL